jgi:hypothetical protein
LTSILARALNINNGAIEVFNIKRVIGMPWIIQLEFDFVFLPEIDDEGNGRSTLSLNSLLDFM